MSLALKCCPRHMFALLMLAGFLAGCGGSGSNPASNTPGNPLTNPDAVLFASGRAPDASWHFYAMNPDGSNVVLVPTLNRWNASRNEGIAVNQSGTFAGLTFDLGVQPGPGPSVTRHLVRLSDGATLFSGFMSRVGPQTLFAANSSGSQIAFLGSPIGTDPYALYLVAPDGTQKTRIYDVPAVAPITEILFAPDDRTLYFAALISGINPLAPVGVLYRLPRGATTPIQVASVEGPITSVHTSRDGSRLAFLQVTQAADSQSATIVPYTVNANGSGLTQGATIAVAASLNPWDAAIASRADGFHVLYVAPVDGANEIFDVRLDGSARTQITFNAAGNDSPGSRQATTAGAHRSLGGR